MAGQGISIELNKNYFGVSQSVNFRYIGVTAFTYSATIMIKVNK